MQSFIAVVGCAAAVPAAVMFFLLWRSAERAASNTNWTATKLTSQLRQKNVELEQARLEIERRREADDFRALKRSANVSKGNRNRAAKRAERAAAFFASLTPATEANVSVGTHLIADGGFTCVKQGAELVVEQDAGGLFVPCRTGGHHLDGQLDEGSAYIGLYLAPEKAA